MKKTGFVPLEGRCTCGHVTYRVTAPPLFVHCCHCTWCQRESGSAFAVNALVESSCVEALSGHPEMTEIPSQSGKGQKMVRCPRCRVTLWSHYAGAGEALSFIRVGTLEEAGRVPPDIHIYTSSKQDWVILPEDVPSSTGYYSARETWPAESLERARVLKSR